MNWLCNINHPANINAPRMQLTKIIQAVILMILVALAASCATGKQYGSKLFAPRESPEKDKTASRVRFLQTGEDSLTLQETNLTKRMTTTDSSTFVNSGNETARASADSVAPVIKNKTGNSGVRTKRTRENQ